MYLTHVLKFSDDVATTVFHMFIFLAYACAVPGNISSSSSEFLHSNTVQVELLVICLGESIRRYSGFLLCIVLDALFVDILYCCVKQLTLFCRRFH